MFSFDNGDAPVEYVWMQAAADRAKGDVVWIDMDEDGQIDLAVSSSASVQRAVVAAHAIDSGDFGLYVCKGPVQATVTSGSFTAGNGSETDNGNVEDSGSGMAAADGEAETDFAVAMESGTTVTTLKIFLKGLPYTSTT